MTERLPVWFVPMLVIFICDIASYLLLMDRLGMLSAGVPVIIVCGLRALYLPAARILVVQICHSVRVRITISLVLSAAFYLGIFAHLMYAGYFHTVPHLKALHHLDDLPETLAECGVPALVHTVNSRRHAQRLMRLGVHGIYTDDLCACGQTAEAFPW